MSGGDVGAAWAQSLIEGLISSGVRHFCLAPGSRSTALALASSRSTAATTSIHLDERGAAFYALGYGKATGLPAAVVTTSGTAAANLLPAAVEARLSRTPLVLVTADRPPELRDTGAWQTIDQIKLLGSQVVWFHDLGTPSDDPELLRYARHVGARAAASAAGPGGGPVHVNVPLREPLTGPEGREAVAVPGDQATRLSWAPRPPLDPDVTELVRRIRQTERGLIVAGPMNPRPGLAAALRRLANAAGYPVVADASSNARFSTEEQAEWSAVADSGLVVAGADAILRDAGWTARHSADFVLRFGASPVWRPVAEYVGHQSGSLTVVDPDQTWDDPHRGAAVRLIADPILLAEIVAQKLDEPSLARRRNEPWCRAWLEADKAVDRQCTAVTDSAAPGTSVWVVGAILRALPERALLYAANSMAVREVESFGRSAPPGTKVLVNRGAAGIDGTLSSAMGAAAATRRPTVLLTGDLAFLYDLNALTGAHDGTVPLAVVVLNDRGGGIFAYLDIAREPEFDRAFRLRHGVNLSAACAAFGVTFMHCADRAGLEEAVRVATATPGTTVIEVPVDMEANTAEHRAYWVAVATDIAALA